MNGGKIAAAGLGGAVTGETTAWLWNSILPWLLNVQNVPTMPDGVSVYLGAALLGGLVYLTSFLPKSKEQN